MAVHAVTWIATLIGVALLWKALNRDANVRPSGVGLVGYMLAGWGWFNLVEGLIDHHILNLHHVIQALGQSVWDWMFLASGVILIVIVCAAIGNTSGNIIFYVIGYKGGEVFLRRRLGDEKFNAMRSGYLTKVRKG